MSAGLTYQKRMLAATWKPLRRTDTCSGPMMDVKVIDAEQREIFVVRCEGMVVPVSSRPAGSALIRRGILLHAYISEREASAIFRHAACINTRRGKSLVQVHSSSHLVLKPVV